jgi:hypothetical protein
LLGGLCSSLGRSTLGDIMGTKRQKPMRPQRLEDLLKAHALRRLEGRPSSAPKRAKAKRNSRRSDSRGEWIVGDRNSLRPQAVGTE